MITKHSKNVLGNVRRRIQSLKIMSVSGLLMLALFSSMSMGIISCKKQPTTTEPTAEELKIAEAKRKLQALLTDASMTLEEKEQALAEIKAMNIQDPTVLALIAQVEAKLKAEREELARKAEEAARLKEAELARQREMNSPQYKLNNLFGGISSAASVSEANMQINQALSMFDSPEAPVLIVISEENGEKDYDRPTTIKKYLEYLKDQKKKADAIENIVFDANGKIKELELTKLK